MNIQRLALSSDGSIGGCDVPENKIDIGACK